MCWWRRGAVIAPLAALLLCVPLLLANPGAAIAASGGGHGSGGSPSSSTGGPGHTRPGPPQPPKSPQPPSSPFGPLPSPPPSPFTGAQSPAPPSNQPTGSNGDNTQLLGGTDPLCTQGALSAEAQQNCAASGEPESLQPIANYSLDQNISSGFLGIGNIVQNSAQSVISFLFGLLERVMSLVLLALSLAFGFNLYSADQQHGGQIPATLSQIEHLFTGPLLIFGIVCAAVWLVYQMLAHQRHGRALGGFVAMSVMLIGTLFLMANPQGTIGAFQQATNGLAQFSLGAFSGQQNPSSASYANATPGLWRTMAENPWCAEEFGDINWCMGPIDHAMRARLPALEAHLQSHQNQDGSHDVEANALQDQELALLRDCLARPGTASDPGCTNGELFLSFPTNDNARNGKQDNWTLFNALVNDKTQLSNGQPASVLAQTREAGGISNRLFVMVLTGVGMFFFLLLLIYVAINLLIASMLFVVLLLFAGVMAIVCCIGDWGRQRWLEWAGMTAGALLIKVLYAMYLGVMIAAANVLSAIGQGLGGWELEWILFAALWVLAFAGRRRLMGLLVPGGQHEAHPGLTAATAALPAIVAARAGMRTGRAFATGGRQTVLAGARYVRNRREGQPDPASNGQAHARPENGTGTTFRSSENGHAPQNGDVPQNGHVPENGRAPAAASAGALQKLRRVSRVRERGEYPGVPQASPDPQNGATARPVEESPDRRES